MHCHSLISVIHSSVRLSADLNPSHIVSIVLIPLCYISHLVFFYPPSNPVTTLNHPVVSVQGRSLNNILVRVLVVNNVAAKLLVTRVGQHEKRGNDNETANNATRADGGVEK